MARSVEPELALDDFTGSDVHGRTRRYLLEPVAGRYRAERCPANEVPRPEGVGFGQERRVGLGPVRDVAFAAVYVDGDYVRFAIAGSPVMPEPSIIVDLGDPAVRVSRTAVAPFVRQVSVTYQTKQILALRYWRVDLDGFPDTAHSDLFAFAQSLQAKPEELAGFWFLRRNRQIIRSIPTEGEIREHTVYGRAAAASVGTASPLPPFLASRLRT
jgi:hypothetical protein